MHYEFEKSDNTCIECAFTKVYILSLLKPWPRRQTVSAMTVPASHPMNCDDGKRYVHDDNEGGIILSYALLK